MTPSDICKNVSSTLGNLLFPPLGFPLCIQWMPLLHFSCPHPLLPPTSLSHPSSPRPLLHTCSLHAFLCMAGLIEYLNKLINHGRPAKTDRSREVMFITKPHPPPPSDFVSLIPTCSLFCWMCTFTPLSSLTAPPPLKSLCQAKVILVYTLIHYLWFYIENKCPPQHTLPSFPLLLESGYLGTLIKNNE